MKSGPDESVAVEAARWLARRDRGLTAEEMESFVEWQASDPRHEAEFARLDSAWASFDLAKTEPELAEMARALDEKTSVRPLRRSRRVLGWAFCAAAAAAAIMLSIPGKRQPEAPGKPPYQVISSAARRLVLDDGSVAELRGDCEIRVEFTAAKRRIRLLRGEAYFTVTKNAARPFLVDAGRVTVRAVGTAFSVKNDATQVEVMVTEGRVSLGGMPLRPDLAEPGDKALGKGPLVAAGQRVVVRPDPRSGSSGEMTVDSLTATEMDEALSWQDTWLVFQRTSLSDALVAFNRYGTQRLTLADDSLREAKLMGKFRADHVEGFIHLLEQTMHLRAERRGEHEIVLKPAP